MSNHGLIFLDGRLFVLDVPADGNNLGLLLANQAADIGFLLLYRRFRLVQKPFFSFQLFFAQLHVLSGLHILIQLLPVIARKGFDVIGPVYDPRNTVGAEKSFHIKGIASLIHELDALFHGGILFLLLHHSLLQLLRGYLNLFLFLGNQCIIFLNLLLYVSKLPVQLLNISRQVAFGLFQLLFKLLHIRQVTFQSGNLFFGLFNLPLLLPDALVSHRLSGNPGNCAGNHKRKTQT